MYCQTFIKPFVLEMVPCCPSVIFLRVSSDGLKIIARIKVIKKMVVVNMNIFMVLLA